MGKNVPIRHHYIPRFILKPFCNQDGYLTYYDKATGSASKKKPEEIFVIKNMYRDTVNHADNPIQIENDLAKLEDEAARIISKFRVDDDIEITYEEEQRLKIFFAVMGFRSKRAQDTFAVDAPQDYHDFYNEEGNLNDYWKRNLGEIVNCRSVEELIKNPRIDRTIKLFMMRDTEGLLGTYFTVVERRGHENFILSDAYPVVVYGVADAGEEVPVYSIFPISPSRAVLLVSNGITLTRESVSVIDRKCFQMPKLKRAGKLISIHVQRIYEKDVQFLNQLAKENTTDGLVLTKLSNQ